MKQETLQLTGANYNKDRRALDFYPTPAEVTVALMLFLTAAVDDFWDCFHIYEPACGDGAMSEAILPYVLKVSSTDIRNTGYGIGGIDFLKTPCVFKPDAIITNPPFNSAELFIKKAIAEAPIVAMLLKSQYWHAKSRLSLSLILTHRLIYFLSLGDRISLMETKAANLRWNAYGPFGLKATPLLNINRYKNHYDRKTYRR